MLLGYVFVMTEIHIHITFYISDKSSKIRLRGYDIFLSIRDNNAKDMNGGKAAAMSRTQFSHSRGSSKKVLTLEK